MSSTRETAAEILPHFATAVLARKQHTYGHYARLIGRNPAKESMIVGPAMHLIGALCIISQVPVAPLYWVKRSDGEEKQVFTSDPIEVEHVLPYRNMMYVVSREYTPIRNPNSMRSLDGCRKSYKIDGRPIGRHILCGMN